MSKKTLRTCPQGHRYYKSSDCPVCPECEKVQRQETNFLTMLGAPARRALENNGITTLQQLASRSEAELLRLHGFGPATLPKLRALLKKQNLSFKK